MIKTKLPALLLLLAALWPACGGDKTKPTILLVTIDTLRYDHLGAYGYPRNTSPFIDRLARNGILFKKAITPIPITAGSHASILTALHPLTHGLTTNGDNLNEKVETLAEHLKTNGYYTIAANGTRMLSEKHNFNQGFDAFSAGSKEYQRSAEAVNKSLFQLLDDYQSQQNDKPLFIWLHYYDPHTPYINHGITFDRDIPEHLRGETKKHLKEIEAYDTEIRYTDNALEKVFQYLEENGLAEKLISCITADHGEQLGEHGAFKVHYDFYSETTFVPLILNGYNIPRGKHIDTPVSTMDIAGTLAKPAGAPFKHKTDGMVLPFKNTNPKRKSPRDFLIIGHPAYIKSIQLLRFPFSYILNFDRFYKNWFVSETCLVPPNRFKPVQAGHISVKKKKYKEITIDFPDQFKQGREYVVARFKLEETENVKKKVRVWFNYRMTTEIKLDKKTENLYVYHPVTTLDRDSLSIILSLQHDTELKEATYAFLTKNEMIKYTRPIKKIKRKMTGIIRTLRNHSETDEWYNLQEDMAMKKNLLERNSPTLIKKAERYRNQLYRWFKQYRAKGRKSFKRPKDTHEMSPEQKKMLKTLGYL